MPQDCFHSRFAMPIQDAYLIAIHQHSLGAFLGAVLILFLFCYFFSFFYYFRAQQLILKINLFFVSLFFFLLGYAMYSSSQTPADTQFWTKVCYSGVSLTVYSFWVFAETIFRVEHRVYKSALLVVSVAMVAFIWFDDTLLITAEINPDKQHASVIKGDWFVAYMAAVFLCLTTTLILLVKHCLQRKYIGRETMPILIGLGIWFANGVMDGVLAAWLNVISAQLWIGPVAMAVSTTLYIGNKVGRQNIELSRVKKENEAIFNELITDQLTGLYSRDFFMKSLENRLSQLKRGDAIDSLMFIDLDNFKACNDTLGHTAGDDVLKLLGQLCESRLRESDIAARFGGDEFLLLLPACKAETARQLAKNMQLQFDEQYRLLVADPEAPRVTLSIGLVESTDWGGETADIIVQADLAMYEAKKSGKNGIYQYREALSELN